MPAGQSNQVSSSLPRTRISYLATPPLVITCIPVWLRGIAQTQLTVALQQPLGVGRHPQPVRQAVVADDRGAERADEPRLGVERVTPLQQAPQTVEREVLVPRQ